MTITLDNATSPYLDEALNLDIAAGIHGIIGPNGAGKTTLLRLIAGHHRLRSGTLHTGSSSLSRAGADATFAGHTIRDHLAVAQLGHPQLDAELAATVLGIAGLSPAAVIRNLSVGHRQLVSIAAALAAGTEVTLLDEPFNGLDVRTRGELRQLLITAAAERTTWTLLISSHRSEDLAGLVSDVISLHDGRAHGPIELDQVREDYPTLVGPTAEVQALAAGHPVIGQATLGPTLRVTLAAPLSTSAARRAAATGVDITHPDDQTLIDLLSTSAPDHTPEGR